MRGGVTANGRHALWVALRLTLVSLVAAELFLRFVRPVEFRALPGPDLLDGNDDLLYRRSDVPGLLYDLAPSMKKAIIAATWVETNSQGMRDHEPLPADTRGLVRLAVLGDSFSFGLGVPVEDAYPEVLERALNSSAPAGRRFDVLNFSVPGYSSRQEAVAMTAKVLPWRPQVVILGYVLNDPETAPLHPVHSHFSPAEWWQHFHLTRLAVLLALTMQTKRHGGGDYFKYLHAPEAGRWSSTEAAFDEMAEHSRAAGARVLVVIFPIVEVESWREYPYRELHRQVADAARARGLDVLDLLPHYERYPPRDLRLSELDHHPTKLGHAVAAAAIAQHLRAGGAWGEK
jgi:lysophospholipase L1-like esterase